MAVGTGTDAAIGAAGLTLVSGDPVSIADAVLLARATLRVIYVNLGWAFGYNLAVIPLAALGYLNPLFAGIAMSASSLIVVTNSLRLRRFHARRPARSQRVLPAAPALRRRTMTTTVPAYPSSAAATAPSRLAELARAAAAPVIAAALVTGLLSVWVITGGAGTVSRIRVEVGLAAIPMRAYIASAASAIRTAPTYLTIRNLSSEPDELLSVRTPISSHVILAGPPGPHGVRPVVAGLAVRPTAASL